MYWQGEGQGSSHFRSSDSKSETSIDVSELLTQGLGRQIFFNHISVFLLNFSKFFTHIFQNTLKLFITLQGK